MNEANNDNATIPTQSTRSVTLSLPEWCFLMVNLIVSAAKTSRSVAVSRYIQPNLSSDQPNSVNLNFVHEENRSFTVQLPKEHYDIVYQNAARDKIREGEYLTRLLTSIFPAEAVARMQELLAILKQASVSLSPTNEAPTRLANGQGMTTEDSSSHWAPANTHDELENFINSQTQRFMAQSEPSSGSEASTTTNPDYHDLVNQALDEASQDKPLRSTEDEADAA